MTTSVHVEHLPGAAASGSGCGCGCGGSGGCGDALGRERTRFFAGRVLGAEDFTQDQRYFREKHRRHNRLMHGWGVVCGLAVAPAGDRDFTPVPYTVCVQPGYALAPQGDEILLEEAVAVDVREILERPGGECPPPRDPWCHPVRTDREAGRTFYLAIRYDERPDRPVLVDGGCGCGHEEPGCEDSRIVEGWSLAVLDALPEGHDPADLAGDWPGAGQAAINRHLAATVTCVDREGVRACPSCPESPWVVIADLRLGADGTVTVDQLAHRRWTASFGGYAFFCAAAPDRREELPPPPAPVAVTEIVLVEAIGAVLVPTAAKALARSQAASTAAELPARHLRGAGGGPVSKLLAARTIKEVAELDDALFIGAAEAAGADREDARAVLDRARMVTTLTGG